MKLNCYLNVNKLAICNKTSANSSILTFMEVRGVCSVNSRPVLLMLMLICRRDAVTGSASVTSEPAIGSELSVDIAQLV